MSRRELDPEGLSESPVGVSDPAREAELVAQVRRKMAFLHKSYVCSKRFYGDPLHHNDAIGALERLAAGKAPHRAALKRLPPIVGLLVSQKARLLARDRVGREDAEVEGEDIRAAAICMADVLKKISNRPADANLARHVEGLMILLQDATGKPVVPRRYRNSDYDPHFKPGVSELVPLMFEWIDPSVTMTRLVTIAERVRAKWAGRYVSFEEHFPNYAPKMREDGTLLFRNGWVIEAIEPSIPTYFHSRRN